MIKSIKTFLDNATELNLATKKTYKKPTGNTQPTTYIYFISSWGKVRIKTGYRQRFSFYVVSDNMDNIETLSNNLETLLVGNGYAINTKLWKILQNGERDFEDEMIRVIDYTFYYKFA